MSAQEILNPLDRYLGLNDHNVRAARYLLAAAITPILLIMGNAESIADAELVVKFLATTSLISLFVVVLLIAGLMVLDLRLSERLLYAAASAAEQGAPIEQAVKEVWDGQNGYPRIVRFPILIGGVLGYGSLVALIWFQIWL